MYLASETRLSQSVKKGLVAPYNSWKNRIATLKFVQDIPITTKDRSYARVRKVDQGLCALDPEKLMFLWGTRDFVFDIHFLEDVITSYSIHYTKLYDKSHLGVKGLGPGYPAGHHGISPA